MEREVVAYIQELLRPAQAREEPVEEAQLEIGLRIVESAQHCRESLAVRMQGS